MNEIKKYMKGRHELLCIPMVLIHKLAPPPHPKMQCILWWVIYIHVHILL